MSREFGEGPGGFFHDKIRNARDDIKHEADWNLHKKFAPLFDELYELAYAISSVEAGDSCLDRTILELMDRLPKIKKWTEDMEEEIEPYRRVAESAVRKAVNK